MNPLASICSYLFIISVLLCPIHSFGKEEVKSAVSSLVARAGIANSTELKKLSVRLEALQIRLSGKIPIDAIYIGGGSGRAVLDHIYFNKPLNLRDIDIYVIPARPFTREEMELITREIEGEPLGNVTEAGKPSIRTNPALSLNTRDHYVAGYTTTYNQNGVDLELKFVGSRADMELSGLSTLDTVRVKLPEKGNLLRYAADTLTKMPFGVLTNREQILNHLEGYEHWVSGKVKLWNWEDISRDSLKHSIRIARTYGKLAVKSLDTSDKTKLVQLNRNAQVRNLGPMLGELSKVISDSPAVAALELKLLVEIESLQQWIPSLARFVSNISSKELEDLLQQADSRHSDKLRARLTAMLEMMTMDDQKSFRNVLTGTGQPVSDFFLPRLELPASCSKLYERISFHLFSLPVFS